ncbi:conserved hypothetical protein [Flavobacterium sp. 9AF]|uniref:tetratricopeptide repeat protein n=1 Tax=Flavobacterium sp. 9AF TaxID=2653142 RepID=UPI0012F1429B|nr:tetratricopeptide repeat protein [Flavobacterium sp. 9AF]VXB27510.1 conserved hypothetical protein [Flavobacterium sp. 9AF]
MKEEMFLVFDQYLANEMTRQEKLDFENQLQIDEELKEEFELYRATDYYLQNEFSSETENFKNNLKIISRQYHDASKEKKKKIIPISYRWYAVAASLLLFLSIWFFMKNTIPEYSDFNEHEKAYFTERGETDINLKQAEEAFNNKNYKIAIASFESINRKELGVEEKLIYAVALLEEDQFVKAESILQNIKSQNTVFKNKALWYLAMSKLKQKEYEDCKVFLEEIPKEAEEYKGAQILLSKL